MRRSWPVLLLIVAVMVPCAALSAEPARIVFIAGSSTYKPGEHEYRAGTRVLMDLVRQTPGVEPVLAIDWPEQPEILAGARSIVMFADGGDKHPLVQADRFTQLRTLCDQGTGLVMLHQLADVPVKFGDDLRGLVGGAWQQGTSQRAHWVARFETFPAHPIFRGVTPFTIDDGWLTSNQFVAGKTGVTPLLRTVAPKGAGSSIDDSIVAWAFERPGGARAFTFTGGHLHKSLSEEGYRRFLINGILWTAHVDVPAQGAPVALGANQLDAALKVRQER